MKRLIAGAADVLLAVAALSAQSAPNDARAREILKQLVEINTSESSGSCTSAAEAVAARLKAAGFPAADVQVVGPNPRKRNLVARLRGTGARRPLLLLAHLDVVEARREDWSSDPFVLVEKDGFFYGRGTSDDKAMASMLIANLLRLKDEGFRPDRDLILALTADEESGDSNGVKWLLAHHRDLLDAGLALNEGGAGQILDGKYFVNEVQSSEKVYQDFRLEARNPGGHSSRPVRDNAIYHLSEGLSRLADYEFPLHLTDVTRAYLQQMAALTENHQLAADMRAVARTRPDADAAARLSEISPFYRALLHTTCVATRLEGGHANNALPQLAAATVNCRILPGERPADIKRQIEHVVDDPKITVSFIDEATPSAPSPLAPGILGPIERITAEIWPGVTVVPVMNTGATDGVYLRNAGIPTYGVEGIFYDLDGNRAHGRDERVGVKQYFEGLEFQYRLVKALSSRP